MIRLIRAPAEALLRTRVSRVSSNQPQAGRQAGEVVDAHLDMYTRVTHGALVDLRTDRSRTAVNTSASSSHGPRM